jgi:hypothetical protein
LKYPEKNAYFANQILKIKELKDKNLKQWQLCYQY